ncbi:TetR/AcrR family transcriptional regulator [Clostridium sp. YIM B02505]|uniref:TetR/AcrR family transcriptional regulator n=1 Tax=Clostridium yunnanense TaxID=2800325 RepID=A0ABS1ES31_9CLOT|nr:TetR/AcrR family transcriptional regulator [Clostridium yunnanense]MBK1812162.1 TetR/AcrR family transcriptional regulator [Clostridium yunnanense]
MENVNQNKTALKYKEWIINAFMELLKEYKYNEITIKQITLQADVSRQTFYRHYKSKDEIIHEYSNKVCDEISEKLLSLEDKSIYQVTLTYFTFWRSYLDLLYLVRSSGCEHLLVEHYNEIMLKTLDILRPSMPQYTDEEFRLIKAFLIGGFYNVKSTWMDNNLSNSPEELAKLICSIID